MREGGGTVPFLIGAIATMSSDNKNSNERDLELSFDDEGDNIEAVKFESDSSSEEGGSDNEGNRTTQPESFTSHQWPQSYK